MNDGDDNNNQETSGSENVPRTLFEREDDEIDIIELLKNSLKEIEKYGLSDQDGALIASQTGMWDFKTQLAVSAYIRHLRFKNTVIYKSLELIAAGEISKNNTQEFAAEALKAVSIRKWRNTNEGS